MEQVFTGNIVDVFERQVFYGELTVVGKRISSLTKISDPVPAAPYLLPGFVDSHVHIESSMLVPAEFAKLAVVHGTVATVSDPHEIANVCGVTGVEFMIENGKTVPFKFHFGAPSCVPATSFETAGASLDAKTVERLMQNDDIYYLSEVMNFPGVLAGAPDVLQKIEAAKKNNKPIDGHAPGLRGADAHAYIAAGISTDHECFTAEEALDKLGFGMKILIREGSAARNFDALIGLLDRHADAMMFCSDDKHPDSLVAGHINQLCARAIAAGCDVFNVLQAACVNPVLHYGLRCGLLRPGDAADFIAVKDLLNFKVLQTFIDGELVAENGRSLIDASPAPVINRFDCNELVPGDLVVSLYQQKEVPVIGALEGQLITEKLTATPSIGGNELVSDTTADILKIVVVNRYRDAPVAKSFVKGFGLKQGALASSVAHDSHNIIAVGVDDESLCKAINLVIRERGGIACISGDEESVLPLPVGGLMSTQDGYAVARAYTAIDQMVKDGCGSCLAAPFMTLSFMALLVIPHLKLSDRGLFDGDTFQLINPPLPPSP